MNMKTNRNKFILYKYLLAFLGLFMISLYIWFRFIRTRIPRVIPFNFSVLGFFTIIIIIISLTFILYRLIYPKIPSQFILDILKQLVKVLLPLKILDDIIKKPKTIQKSILLIFYKVIQRTNLYDYDYNYYLMFFLTIIPKILLLLAFMFDIFILHKIEFFYYCLLLNILPLLYHYLVYTLAKQLEIYTLYLEKRFYIEMISTSKEEDESEIALFMCPINNLKDHKDDEDDEPDYWNGVVPFKDVRFFIDMQACNLVFYYKMYEYTCVETDYAREEYLKTYKGTKTIKGRNQYIPDYDEVSVILRKDFEDIIPKVVYLKAFLDVYISNKKPKKFDKIIMIITIIGYICSWIYILVISFHTLNILNLLDIIQNTGLNIPEPFTEIIANNEEIS